MVASDDTLRQSHPQVQALCDDLDMPKVMKVCIEQQMSKSSRPASQTGFDYLAWLQMIQTWFNKNYESCISQRTQTTNTMTSNLPANYQYQPGTFGMAAFPDTRMDIPPDESFPWISLPDLLADNPLAGWMDLGMPWN